jgi:succinyl-CoA synthetase beta subunit
MKQFKINV